MNDTLYKGKTAVEYAKMACDTMMKKFAPQDLPPKDRFFYHQGVFLSGFQKTWHLTGEEKYYQYIKDYIDHVIDADGNFIGQWSAGELDCCQPGILLFELYERTGNEVYKKVLDKLIDALLHIPKNVLGGVFHMDRFPNQMWLDGLYMGGPIMMEYGAKYGHTEYFDYCGYQDLLMQRLCRDPKTGLMYHACDYSKVEPWADPVTGCSPEFWGRAMGWVPVALMDELEFFPGDHPMRKPVIDMLVNLLTALKKYQDPETGLWYQVVDKGGDEGNWVESSCTCLYASAMIRAVAKGYLDESFRDVAMKAYHGIIDRLRYDENGGVIVDNICVGTCVGDYEFYKARPTGENDLHGIGAFLLLMAAIADNI